MARVLVGAMVLVALLVVGWRLIHDDGNSGGGEASIIATPPAEFNDADAQTIETALNSGDPEQVSVVLEPSIAAVYDLDPTPLFPPGAVVDIDPASFQSGRDDAATVDATVTGAQPRFWTLILVQRGANWLLVSTVER